MASQGDQDRDGGPGGTAGAGRGAGGPATATGEQNSVRPDAAVEPRTPEVDPKTAAAIAGIATLFKGPYRGPRTLPGSASGRAESGSGSSSRFVAGSETKGELGRSKGAGGGQGAAGSSLPPGAVKLGPSKRLPAESAATYTDPAEGTPDILIREADGSLKAFSAVCTHAGCTVGYEGGVIVCPCHGGEYSAETGEVIAGPPPQGLAPRQVVEQGGQIYAVPS